MSTPPVRLAVIGAGAAGRQFALACAAAGLMVTLEDVMPSNLRRAEAEFQSLGRDVRLAMTVEDAVEDADLAVDFVPDELESKLEIFSLLDRMAPPRTILLTPSECLSITDLASCTYRADRCIMVRGLTGSPRLLTARATSASTRQLASAVLTTLGHTAPVEPDPDLPMLVKNMNLPVGSDL